MKKALIALLVFASLLFFSNSSMADMSIIQKHQLKTGDSIMFSKSETESFGVYVDDIYEYKVVEFFQFSSIIDINFDGEDVYLIEEGNINYYEDYYGVISSEYKKWAQFNPIKDDKNAYLKIITVTKYRGQNRTELLMETYYDDE